jgi:uracil-DNA glycosylase
MTSHSIDGARAMALTATVLDWYRAMGVDAALDDTPTDWLQRGDRRPGAEYTLPETTAPTAPQHTSTPAKRPPAQRPSLLAPTTPKPSLSVVPSATRPIPVAAPDEAALSARATAQAATSIEDLQSRLAAFDGCSLKTFAKSLCFYRGATPARVMVLGEAPGAEEDKQGKPFVGPAGQMLDKMLASIGLDETTVHISNIVYWRPPGNRTPTPQEALVCRPFLERQVEFVKPEVLLLLGGPASHHIFDVTEGIMKLRGKWKDVTIGTHTCRAIATLHPAYLLRSPAAKRHVWRDLLAIETALAGK